MKRDGDGDKENLKYVNGLKQGANQLSGREKVSRAEARPENTKRSCMTDASHGLSTTR